MLALRVLRRIPASELAVSPEMLVVRRASLTVAGAR